MFLLCLMSRCVHLCTLEIVQFGSGCSTLSSMFDFPYITVFRLSLSLFLSLCYARTNSVDFRKIYNPFNYIGRGQIDLIVSNRVAVFTLPLYKTLAFDQKPFIALIIRFFFKQSFNLIKFINTLVIVLYSILPLIETRFSN